MNYEEFLKKAIDVHGEKFLYSKSQENFKGWKQKIIIICKIHGEFLQTPNNHISNKRGCPICGKIRRALIATKTTSNFIESASKLHNNFYDYSEVNYINNSSKIKIICKIHGKFLQSPSKHLIGQGCFKCKLIDNGDRTRDTIENFIYKANIIHNHKYIYDETVYGQNAHCKIKIICKIHGAFIQTPTHHLGGKGCSSCQHIISNSEIEWLDSLNIPIKFRQKHIIVNNKLFKVDAYDPNTNTIYEYYGNFWHGNPLIYNSNDVNRVNEKTMERERCLINAGFKLITIWGK